MRRIVPWALLVALLVGVGIGAVVGQVQTPGQTPAQWVDGVLAATKAAGTAHMTVDSVSTSPNPVLQASSVGSGVLDFRTENASVTQVSRSDQSSSTDGGPMHSSVVRQVDETVDIGTSSYQRQSGFWTKVPRVTNSDDPLGLDDAVGPFSLGLGPTAAGEPIADVQDLGAVTVDGTSTTRYLVTTRLPSCGAAQAAARAGNYWGPTTLWVDGQGRLVQARSALHLDLKFPRSLIRRLQKALPKSQRDQTLPIAPTGPETIVSTLHLTDFGAPVRITAPTSTTQPQPFNMVQIKGVGVGATRVTGESRGVAHSRTC